MNSVDVPQLIKSMFVQVLLRAFCVTGANYKDFVQLKEIQLNSDKITERKCFLSNPLNQIGLKLSLFQMSIMSDGVEIPVHLIGDTSFPLKPWLMKGYSQEHQLSLEQRRFTYSLTSAHSVVGEAFAQLKGRWRCLQKKSDINILMMPRVIAACCVLHNICEYQDDRFLPEWNTETAPPANHLIQPDTETYDGDAYCTAEVIRDAITYNLLTILDY